MDLIPVIDLMQGQVVRGVAGERARYAPNRSCLVNSSDPLETALALIGRFRPNCLYVADLDAIQTGKVQTECLENLVRCSAPLAVDAGVKSVEAARHLVELGVAKVVVGLETLPELGLLERFVSDLGVEAVIFSLDLRNGRPLGPGAGRTPVDVVSEAIQLGVHQLIVLDLESVGVSRGVPTGPLCHAIKSRWPDLIVWTGGGIRSLPDLHRLSLFRLDGVMVASALHDGRITPADWRTFEDLLSDDQTMLMMDA